MSQELQTLANAITLEDFPSQCFDLSKIINRVTKSQSVLKSLTTEEVSITKYEKVKVRLFVLSLSMF